MRVAVFVRPSTVVVVYHVYGARVYESQIEELVHPPNGIFCMLKAYFDESGIHAGSKACLVAGYLGKIGPWRELVNGWKATLKKFGVPLHEFHAKDAVKKTGFFLPWERDKSNAFLAELCKVTSESRIRPVCYGVFTDDFLSLSISERRFLTGATWDGEKKKFLSSGNPNKPYFVAFIECLKVATAHCPTAERVHFFFGTDRPASKYANGLFRYLELRAKAMQRSKSAIYQEANPAKWGTIDFPKAGETPQLQVADLFSYLGYNHILERRQNGDWNTPPSGLLLALLRNRRSPLDTSYRTAELLRNMISVVPGLPKT